MNCQRIIDVTQKWLKKKPASGDKTVRAKYYEPALRSGMQLQFEVSGRKDVDVAQGKGVKKPASGGRYLRAKPSGCSFPRAITD
jgi:hypothetical protein